MEWHADDYSISQRYVTYSRSYMGRLAHLSAGTGLGGLFLVMLGLMAFRALTGASARAAVPICVANEAYCSYTMCGYRSYVADAAPMKHCVGAMGSLLPS